MPIFKRSCARHRAETPTRAVRTTTIAAAAGAAIIGSVAPAQAYAELPTASGAVYSAATASSVTDYTTATYQSPAAPQTVAQPTVATQTTGASAVSTQASSISAVTTASGIVGKALSAEGTGYVWGGTTYGAWDCSGFTQWVYAQSGIELPRTSFQQIAAATPTATPKPGDLVSQNNGNHIGIYIGGGKMISALNPTQGTVIHSVNAMPLDGYYSVR